MAAAATNRDLRGVGCRHERPRSEQERAGRYAGMVVHAEDRVAGKALEQSIGDHLLRTAVLAGFLGWLEHQVHGAREVARLRELLRGAEQHRRVAVVAAGVHHAGNSARPRLAGFLGDGQRVHVGPDRHAAPTIVDLQRADDAIAADVARDFPSPAFEARGHQFRCDGFLEGQLGTAVQLVARIAQRFGGVEQVGELAVRGVAGVHSVSSGGRTAVSRKPALTARGR
jgi:hypothetical protein